MRSARPPFSDQETSAVTAAPRNVQVELGAAQLLDRDRHGQSRAARSFCLQRAQVSHAVVVTDEQVEKPHANRAAESLSQAGATVDLLVIESGEQSKSVESATWLWQKCSNSGRDENL